MAAPFEPSEYNRAPVITVSSGVSLAQALVDASPKDAPAGVKKAKNHLKTVAEQASDDLAARNKSLGAYTEEDSRDLDNEADRAWGGLRLALTAKAMLPADRFPVAGRAAELGMALFSGGMDFLKTEYSAQSATMGALLKQIDDDGLAGDIDNVVGPEFLQAIRAVQPRYEAMVSERLRRDKDMGQNLVETVRSLQGAIVGYANKVIGTIEHDDPATTEWARLALLPIANHRAGNAIRAQRAAVPAEPAAPPADQKKPS